MGNKTAGDHPQDVDAFGAPPNVCRAQREGAIGIFDSGVGGLTVFQAVAARLPDEPIVYLGDTARVPYGTKSPETVVRYAQSCAGILLARGVKLLVVACNTASAFALDALRASVEVPVIGVVEPGARAALGRTRNRRIGVIGTSGTVSSGAYLRAIRALSPDSEVFAQACPLFVPLAEEGWTEGEVPRAVAREYLRPLLNNAIDTLILGCTHYPLLARTIGAVSGPGVTLVDSAAETAQAVAATLEDLGLRAQSTGPARREFLVTDAPEVFTRVAKRFLDAELHNVEWVDF
ncbi:MAG: glutamate racemase [Candidatus Hydrogenedentes bacterium]|nr:glutamate racemase [Candidatus Hydrogenedentota bacterium]